MPATEFLQPDNEGRLPPVSLRRFLARQTGRSSLSTRCVSQEESVAPFWEWRRLAWLSDQPIRRSAQNRADELEMKTLEQAMARI